MAYSSVPTVATGDLWTAANHNTYVRDNFAAGVPDIFTTKGDLAVASAADVAQRLAVGADGQVLMADSAQAYGIKWSEIASSLIAKRRGGSSTEWSQGGSNNYDVVNPMIQIGSVSATINGTSKEVIVNFPVGYKYEPLVYVTALSANSLVPAQAFGSYVMALDKNYFYAAIKAAVSLTHTFYIHWLAIGEKNV